MILKYLFTVLMFQNYRKIHSVGIVISKEMHLGSGLLSFTHVLASGTCSPNLPRLLCLMLTSMEFAGTRAAGYLALLCCRILCEGGRNGLPRSHRS